MVMQIVYGEESRLLPWAAERIGVRRFRTDAYSIGQERDGELCAVVVFDNFTEHDCMMHVASDGSRRWLTRDLLVSAFAYPFIQLGLRRVTSPIASRNKDSLAFNQHLGFKQEGRHPFAAGDDDVITLGLLREQCRFVDQNLLRN